MSVIKSVMEAVDFQSNILKFPEKLDTVINVYHKHVSIVQGLDFLIYK